MAFKGTSRVGPEEYSQIIQRNGGEDNGWTSWDYTCYFSELASDRITIAMDLLADQMANLRLDSLEFKSEREVVKEERRLGENSPYDLVFEEMMAAAFKSHPYQWPIIGWMGDITNITRSDLLKYYRTRYVPNNATAVVVGDVDAGEAVEEVRKYFGSIPAGEVPSAVDIREPEQTGERTVKVVKQAEMPALMIGYHGVAAGDPDEYVLLVIERILSGGRSARLYRKLVYEQGLALQAQAGNLQARDPMLFFAWGIPQLGHTVEELKTALSAELDRLRAEPVSDRELTKAKNQLEASFLFDQENVAGIGEAIGYYDALGSYEYLNTYLDRIRKVTAEDVIRVARKHFREENRTVAILVPKEDGEAY
jgi:zinc protease